MIKVNEYLDSEYIINQGLPKSKAVQKLSEDFGVAYVTVYRWIKDGGYYIVSNGGERRVAVKQVAAN